MRAAFGFMLVFFVSPTWAENASDWLCEDHMGRTYLSNHKVEWEKCNAPTAEQMAAVNASTIASRSVKPFCATQKGATCLAVMLDDEVGKIGDVQYHLYRDSASIAIELGTAPDEGSDGSWRISCSRDKMSEVKTCFVQRGDLWAFFSSRGAPIISVGNQHFPGSVTSIKVGQRRFDTAHRDGNFANPQQIIATMKDGQPIVTRYMRWPYRAWEEGEFQSTGFQASTKLAAWLVKNGQFR